MHSRFPRPKHYLESLHAELATLLQLGFVDSMKAVAQRTKLQEALQQGLVILSSDEEPFGTFSGLNCPLQHVVGSLLLP